MEAVWLSHVIENSTPLYGGGDGIDIRLDKSIIKGDSCNTSTLEFPSHAGTHLDAPYHFLEKGKAVDVCRPEEFVFDHTFVLRVMVKPGELIFPKDILSRIPEQTDLILIQTEFEKLRGKNIYWESGPGLSLEIANYFIDNCPALRAVGMDFISISSLKHREIGRKAHKIFLGNNIFLIEDMKLADLSPEKLVQKVIAMPLRFFKGDGAPCTIIGFTDDIINR